MPISADTAVFPENAVELIASSVQLLDDTLSVFMRPLRNTDPEFTVGVFGARWEPDDSSYEMRGQANRGPSLSRYMIVIQAMVKDMEEVRGLRRSSNLGAAIRVMLLRDPALGVAFQSLRATPGGTTESSRRWGVRAHDFISNELSGTWTYLSTLEFMIETETV